MVTERNQDEASRQPSHVTTRCFLGLNAFSLPLIGEGRWSQSLAVLKLFGYHPPH
jgi:hypothetical protein